MSRAVTGTERPKAATRERRRRLCVCVVAETFSFLLCHQNNFIPLLLGFVKSFNALSFFYLLQMGNWCTRLKRQYPPVVNVRVPTLAEMAVEMKQVLPHNCFPADVLQLVLGYATGLYAHVQRRTDYTKTPRLEENFIFEVFTATICKQLICKYLDETSNHFLPARCDFSERRRRYRTTGFHSEWCDEIAEYIAHQWLLYGPTPYRPIKSPEADTPVLVFDDGSHRKTTCREALYCMQNYPPWCTYDTHIKSDWDTFWWTSDYQRVFIAINRVNGKMFGVESGKLWNACRISDRDGRLRLVYYDQGKPMCLELDDSLIHTITPLKSPVLDPLGGILCPSPIPNTFTVLSTGYARMVHAETGKVTGLHGGPFDLGSMNNSQFTFRGNVGAALSGSRGTELHVFDYDNFTMSQYPIPCSLHTSDSIIETLGWQPLN